MYHVHLMAVSQAWTTNSTSLTLMTLALGKRRGGADQTRLLGGCLTLGISILRVERPCLDPPV